MPVKPGAGWRTFSTCWEIRRLLGNQAAAGKIYLDELNRSGSNLARQTLLDSLHITYGYDGGATLRKQIAEYFDTPEHAAFAVQLLTNPHTDRTAQEAEEDTAAYKTVMRLAAEHRSLFDSATRSEGLAVLLMRTSLRMGDPENVLKISGAFPSDSSLWNIPEIQWIVGSAQFILRNYAGAEQPLLALFQSPQSSREDKAAAAYGLVGVYQKTGSPIEQLRYALWLRAQEGETASPWNALGGTSVENRSVYFGISGFDFGALLDYQLTDDNLRTFIDQSPNASGIRLVRYALAVRLARADRYGEAAEIYNSIGAYRRASRMRQLAGFFYRANDSSLSEDDRLAAQFRFAEFLSDNPERVYFNDTLWGGFQDAALSAHKDVRLTPEERETMAAGERALRDAQEERWRAYQMLNGIVEVAGKSSLGRKAAQLAVRNLRGISGRFERRKEILAADTRLSNWLLH